MAQEATVGMVDGDEQMPVTRRVGRVRLIRVRAQRFGAVAPGHSARVAKHLVRLAAPNLPVRAARAGKSADATVKAVEEMRSIINRIKDIANGIAPVHEQTVTPVALAARGGNDTRMASQELSRMASRLRAVVLGFAA